MAYTIKQSFDEYSSNLNITDKQEKLVSDCRQNVVKALNSKLSLHPTQKSMLIGSYDRDTFTRYLSENDVDLMTVLHYGDNKEWETPDGTVTALSKFKQILQESFPQTDMRIDRNAVTMRLSKFTLDIVPAFRYKDGSYRIPDTYRSEWLPTDPIKFAEKITSVNKNMDGTFVPIIKMIKGWNRENGDLISGFHLECMLYNHYKSYNTSYTYSSTLRVFFSNLPDYLYSACYDPVTFDRIDTYLDNDATVTMRSRAIEKARQAKVISDEAMMYEESYADEPEYAINKWNKLLGEFFPKYG